MDPTKLQKETVARLRQVHGRSLVKEHAPNRTNGKQLVELLSLAGTWEVTLDIEGQVETVHLKQVLFPLPPKENKPGNALDN